MTNEVLKTAELADLLNTDPKAIRALKADHPDVLKEGSHWVKEKGSTALLWTAQGISEAARLMGKPCPMPTTELKEAAIAHIRPHAFGVAAALVDAALVEEVRAILTTPTDEQRDRLSQHIQSSTERLVGMVGAIALRDAFRAANQDAEQLLKAG